MIKKKKKSGKLKLSSLHYLSVLQGNKTQDDKVDST
jgi:hypothetical protein